MLPFVYMALLAAVCLFPGGCCGPKVHLMQADDYSQVGDYTAAILWYALANAKGELNAEGLAGKLRAIDEQVGRSHFCVHLNAATEEAFSTFIGAAEQGAFDRGGDYSAAYTTLMDALQILGCPSSPK